MPVRAESRTLLPRYSVLTGLSATVTVTGRGYIVPPGHLVNQYPSYLKEKKNNFFLSHDFVETAKPYFYGIFLAQNDSNLFCASGNRLSRSSDRTTPTSLSPHRGSRGAVALSVVVFMT